jgi:hypothetical protein
MSVYRVLLSAPHTGARVSVGTGPGGPAALLDGACTIDEELGAAGGAAELDTTGGAAELDTTGGAAELDTTGGAAELEATAVDVGLGPGTLLTSVTTGA